MKFKKVTFANVIQLPKIPQLTSTFSCVVETVYCYCSRPITLGIANSIQHKLQQAANF